MKRFRIESIKTLKLGFPVVVSHLLIISMQFVDTIMAGQISAADLAGLAIASALFHPLVLFSMGILMAVTPMTAQLKGLKQDVEIGQVVKEGFHLALGLSVPSFFL